MILSIFSSLFSMLSSSAISFISPSSSASSFSRSKPVSLLKRISSIALLCASLRANLLISPAFALS